MVTVTLGPGELQAAASIGRKREALRKERGRGKDFATMDRGGTMDQRNEIGAIAEYALARHYGKDVLRNWCETKSFSLEHWTITCDVGANLHVRATGRIHGRLIAHPYDPSAGVFLLARVALPLVIFVGWARGEEVKHPDHWVSWGPGFGKRPAFVYPNALLYPMDTIPPEAVRNVAHPGLPGPSPEPFQPELGGEGGG